MVLCALVGSGSDAQSTPIVPPGPVAAVQLSGYVRHAGTREVVRYALIDTDSGRIRSQSNNDGFFFLRLAPGEHHLRIRAIGFAPLDTIISLTAPVTTDFLLTPRTVQLQQVEVASDREKSDIDPSSPQMSVARLDLSIVRQAPSALGEVDPLRSITLLPGVSRSSDFSTAFSVRGGTSDQNLILLDEATVYNPAHVLGFLSVFNADAVADMTLHKGAIPPRFGGRLSSVLDVRQREGNANERSGTASIGLLSSRLLLEGPLPRTRGSYLLAGRRSYADIFLNFAPDTAIRDSRAYFYDLNAKATLPIGETGSLMASAYAGRDLLSPSSDFEAGWGNVSGTLRWNHIFASRLFSKVSYTVGSYDYKLGFTILEGRADWTSHITSQELRIDESYHFSERNVLEFGTELGAQSLRPGDLVPNDTSVLRPVRIAGRHGLSGALYVGHVFDIGSRFTIQYGARYSHFARRGPGTVYGYANNQPVVWNTALQRYEPGVLQDSTAYTGGTIADYGGIEPRLSMRVGLNATSSVKASYARTRQSLLLATRTNSPTPLDVWEPVGTWIQPQHADQVALGYAATVGDGAYEVSFESYYKRSYNVLDFVEGADVILNPRIETSLLQGVGRAYGLELFARKQLGDITGWVSYTLSRTEQQFAVGPNQGINNGAWFASPTDKTHDLSVVAVRPLWTRWVIGGTFTLASGLPATYPVSRYVIDDYVLPEYGKRNSHRLPIYHRLDASMTRTGNRGDLQFGIFNVYNRYNAQSISFRQSAENVARTEAVQLSVFGIVPSVSYTFKF